MKYTNLFVCLCCCLLLGEMSFGQVTSEINKGIAAVSPNAIQATMTFLADDLVEGRQPGTRGFALASKYVETRLKALGLVPGAGGQSYIQKVPFKKGVIDEAGCAFSLLSDGKKEPFSYGKDFVLVPDLNRATTELTASLVFVGFGIYAPEMGYDDYKKTDVKGKIVVFLNDAPASFPANERAFFSSAAVKYAEAIKRGAKGAIVFSRPEDKRTGWDATVRRGKQGIFKWLDKQGKAINAYEELSGIVTLNPEMAEKLFANAGRKIQSVYEQANAGKLQAFPLKIEAQMKVSTKHSLIESSNLIGILPGSDPVLKEEYVVYAAHLDHFGIGAPVNNDSIYNGAHDNASGVGILLEVAAAFRALPTPPKRSIIFAIVTGEEYGLLGSDYFVNNPTVKVENMVANLSLDMPFFFHPLLDVVPYGALHSSLIKPVEQAATHLSIQISPDPIPEQVVFIRSDHYSFIKKGIPSLFIKSGFMTGNANLDGKKVNLDWRKSTYHTPQDDINQAFEFEAAAKHAHFNFLVGYFIANDPARPSWNKGDFFGGRFSKSGK